MQIEAKAGRSKKVGIREQVGTLTIKADDPVEAAQLADLFWVMKDLSLDEWVAAMQAAVTKDVK